MSSENPSADETRNRMTFCEICLLRLVVEERKQKRCLRECQRSSRHHEAPRPTSSSLSTLTTSADLAEINDLADIKKPHNSQPHPRSCRATKQLEKTLPKLNWQLNGILTAATSLLIISLLLAPGELATSIDKIDHNNRTNIYSPRPSEIRGYYETSRRSDNLRQVGSAHHRSGSAANGGEKEGGLKSDGLVAKEAGRDLVRRASDQSGGASRSDHERVSPESLSPSAANQISQLGQGAGQRMRRSAPSGERYASAGGLCADCLGIPLVAGPSGAIQQQKLDELDSPTQSSQHFDREHQPQLRTSPAKQMDLPSGDPRSSQGRAISRRQQQPQKQPSHRDPHKAAARAHLRHHEVDAYQQQTGWTDYNNQRHHHHSVERPVYRKSYAYKHPTTTTTPPPPPFEPKSDEKCPMTGPLTVCDQIGSYPADMILTKLEGAKMMFGQTYFSLDSLFTDESQHSSEPFEADKPRAAAPINSSTLEESNHHATEPKTNIDHCAHQAEPDTHYGSPQIRSARGDDTNVNSAPSSSQITTPTGAGEPFAEHLVWGQARPRQHHRLQSTFDDGRAPENGHFLGHTSQIASDQREPASGERNVLQQETGNGQEASSAPLNDSPAQMMENRRERPNSLRSVMASDDLALQLAISRAHKHASTQLAEPADEFLYLVERRGVRLRSASRLSGRLNSPNFRDKLASDPRHPDAALMKVHQRKATKSNDYDAVQHNGANRHEQLANYIGAPMEAVGASASSITLASSQPMPSTERNFHNRAKCSLVPPRVGAVGETSGLKMATNSSVMMAPSANTNGSSKGRRKPTAKRSAAGQLYVAAAPSRNADHETTNPISPARPHADLAPRPGSMSKRKRTESDELAPVSSAPYDDASDLEPHWPQQRQITSAMALNEQAELNPAGQLNEAQEFASRTRRQVPITIDNGDRGSRIDPERVEAAAREPGEQVQPVCATKSIYISPRAALNDKKQWKYVVNAAERDPRIKQIIRVDICENPFGPCSDQVSLPLGFTSQCKQKYAKKKLLALDSSSGLLEVDTFFVPSCCVCQLILDSSRPSAPMTLIGEAPPSQPISNSDQDNGDLAAPVSSLDGDSVGSGP